MEVTITLYIAEGNVIQVDAVAGSGFLRSLGNMMREAEAKAAVVQRADGSILLDTSRWKKPWQSVLFATKETLQ